MTDIDLEKIRNIKVLANAWFDGLDSHSKYEYCNELFNHGNYDMLSYNEILALFALCGDI
jgi:uncharacterized membrane protein